MTQFWVLKQGLYPHKVISHVSPVPGGVSDVAARFRAGGCGWGWEGEPRRGVGTGRA